MGRRTDGNVAGHVSRQRDVDTANMATRPRVVKPTDLADLALRDFDAAIAEPREFSQEQALVWAICLLDDSPQLDASGIVNFLKGRLGISAENSAGNSELQRVFIFADRRITLEPVQLSPGFMFPEQIVPQNHARIPVGFETGILVTASSPSGGVPASLALSQLVLALLSTCKQVSKLYWMSSEQLLERRIAAQQLDTNYGKQVWPVNVWVSSRAFDDGSGSVAGYTVGLEKIGGIEFESLDQAGTPAELEGLLDWVACYAVSNFGQLRNGDTIERNAKEILRIRKTQSATIHQGWVYQLHRAIEE